MAVSWCGVELALPAFSFTGLGGAADEGAGQCVCFVNLPTVYLHRDVVDFRKSIDGLAAIVEQQMDLDPFADALYVFCNRHRDRLKVLYWDQTGFCLWYKRLEKAKFKWPRKAS